MGDRLNSKVGAGGTRADLQSLEDCISRPPKEAQGIWKIVLNSLSPTVEGPATNRTE